MATNFTYAQGPLPDKYMCSFHNKEEIKALCKTCNRHVCFICIEEKHKNHDWMTFRALTKQRLDKCKEQINDVKNSKPRLSQDLLHNIEMVKTCRDRIIRETEMLANKTMESLNSEYRQEIETRDSIIFSLESDIKTLEKLVENFEQISISSFQSEIQSERDLNMEFDEVRKTNIKNIDPFLNFVPGEINTQSLQKMLGYMEHNKSRKGEKMGPVTSDLSTLTVTPVSSFQHGNTMVLNINPSSSNNVWIHKFNSTGCEQITDQGQEIQYIEMRMTFEGFTIDNGGDFIFTGYRSCDIYRLTSGGDKTTITNTEPLHPRGISLSSCGDLLVTLEDDETYNTNSNSQRLVRHITLTGQVKRTYQYYPSSNIQLFTRSYRVRQNHNLDICVVDWTSGGTGQLYILHEDGGVKCRYTGQELKQKFDPFDIAFDLNCNILVSDLRNHTIHLLDHTGQFIKYLADDQELEKPRSLCLQHNNLWVGCSGGKVHVFRCEF